MPDLNRRAFVKTAAAFPLVRGLADSAVTPTSEWAFYAGDQAATRYSPLTQITPANVGKLQPAWVHHSAAPESRYRGSVECTPLVTGGVMYIVGADLVIQALDAATGKLLWTNSPLGANAGRRASGVCRGATYWKEGARERLFVPVQNKVWCLDAKIGKAVQEFGGDGAIDL